MLSIQRPGNVSWLMHACWQPRPTLWGQSGAGKGNLTEGIWDDRHPGTAGWQVRACVCVCARWLEGSKWKLMVVQTPNSRWADLRYGPEDSPRELPVHDVLDSAVQSDGSQNKTAWTQCYRELEIHWNSWCCQRTSIEQFTSYPSDTMTQWVVTLFKCNNCGMCRKSSQRVKR